MKKLLAFLLLILVLVACSSSPNSGDGGDDGYDEPDTSFTATVTTPEGTETYSKGAGALSYASMFERFTFVGQSYHYSGGALVKDVVLGFVIPGPDLPPDDVNLLGRGVEVAISVFQPDQTYKAHSTSGSLTLSTGPELITVTFDLHFLTNRDDIPIEAKGQFTVDADYME